MKIKSKTLQWIAVGATGTLLFASSASAGGRLGWGGWGGWGSWGDRGAALNEEEQAAADAAAAEARAAWAEALAARMAAWEEALAARRAAWEEARAAREEARAALIAAMDANSDGEVTRDEYKDYKAAQALARFAEADSDTSGFIEIEELAAVTGLDVESDHLARVFAHLAGDDAMIEPGEFSVRRGHRLRWHFHRKGDDEPADKPADGGEKDGGGEDDPADGGGEEGGGEEAAA